MAGAERLTITLAPDIATTVKAAVATGSYASSAEVIQEALRDWQAKQALRQAEHAALQSDIAQGLADLTAGRVQDFDPGRIIERGRALSANR